MTFRVEIEGAEDPKRKEKTEKALKKAFKDFIGVTVDVVGVKIGELPRSMKKTKRVIDEREL
jgi:phenylacetate-CoA ligase